MAYASRTIDALHSLCISIPDWNARLDKLNSQIALRQTELAKFQRFRNTGSTESPRPNKELVLDESRSENPFLSHESQDILLNPFATPASGNYSALLPSLPPLPPASTGLEMEIGPTPPQSSQPKPKPSQLTTLPICPATAPVAQFSYTTAQRNSTTNSWASTESQMPNHRPRSMIVVYYDSMVQEQFGALVRFLSESRNAMHKGRVAAKMERMHRAVAIGDNIGGGDGYGGGGKEELGERKMTRAAVQHTNYFLAGNEEEKDEKIKKDVEKGIRRRDWLEPLRYHQQQQGPQPLIAVSDSNSRENESLQLPAKKSLSWMNPKHCNIFQTLPQTKNGPTITSDTDEIFTTLDQSLEWAQSQCERAAHQFLRDGHCSAEIGAIRAKLAGVLKSARRELEMRRVAIHDGVGVGTGVATETLTSKPRTSHGDLGLGFDNGMAFEEKSPNQNRNQTDNQQDRDTYQDRLRLRQFRPNIRTPLIPPFPPPSASAFASPPPFPFPSLEVDDEPDTAALDLAPVPLPISRSHDVGLGFYL